MKELRKKFFPGRLFTALVFQKNNFVSLQTPFSLIYPRNFSRKSSITAESNIHRIAFTVI